MSTLAQQIASRVGPSTDLIGGTVMEVSAQGVSVDVLGARLTAAAVLDRYAPWPGDSVLMLRQGSKLYIVDSIGSVRPVTGTVVAAEPGSTITVKYGDAPDAQREMGFLASYAPAVGDSVVIEWTSGLPFVLGRVGILSPPPDPAPTPPPPPPPPAQTQGVATFAAIDAGTWRDGWRGDTGDVIQGVAPGYPGDNAGAWFYGPSLAATLAGATPIAAAIYLDRTNGGDFAAQLLRLQHHAAASRPPGPIPFDGGLQEIAVAVGQSGWFPLDVGLAGTLMLGGGLGIAGGAYMRMRDLNGSPQNGAVSITWRR